VVDLHTAEMNDYHDANIATNSLYIDGVPLDSHEREVARKLSKQTNTQKPKYLNEDLISFYSFVGFFRYFQAISRVLEHTIDPQKNPSRERVLFLFR